VKRRILVLNGPNLGALGTREPSLYGTMSLDEVNRGLEGLGSELACDLEFAQTNHEGILLDTLYAAVGRVDGVLLNPAGFTHTSVALRDAILATRLPVVEVHLSHPASREPFRRQSLISDVVVGSVTGFGPESYALGLRALAGHLRRGPQA
jgi:3-dehydroquinate dehydratase-2